MAKEGTLQMGPTREMREQSTATSLFGHQVDLGPEKASEFHGHTFYRKSFHKPTFCHHCTDMLWGFINQGFICEICNFVSHERCLDYVVSPCSSLAGERVKHPFGHTWSEPQILKKKFCNVCRRKVDDITSVRCEMCEYYCHVHCLDFVVSNCIQYADYDEKRELEGLNPLHQWREGNLPTNSKCAVCKKTCASTECLTSQKCEWCWTTAHTYCYRSLPKDCNLGPIRDILIAPWVLSLPVTNAMVRQADIPTGTDGMKFMNALERSTKSGGGVHQGGGASAAAARMYHRFLSTGLGNGTGEHFEQEKLLSAEDDAHPRLIKRNRHKPLRRTSSADSASAADSPELKGKDDGEEKQDGLIMKLYDGSSSVQRRSSHTINVPKDASASLVVETAMKALHISDNPALYYIAEAIETGGSLVKEKRLVDSAQIAGIYKTCKEPIPSIILRHQERDAKKGLIKVYPGQLQAPVSSISISITSYLSVSDIIEMALHKFGLEEENAEEFTLVEMIMDKDVTERVMDRDECPWPQLIKARRNSIRQMKQTRYYLHKKNQPKPHNAAQLFVGNLPINMSEFKYKQIVQQHLEEAKCKTFSHVGPIYAQYGAVIVGFEDHEAAVAAHNALKEVIYEEKPLTLLFIPEIHDEALHGEATPLLCFVNVKSGGCQGIEVQDMLRKMLNPYQVFNLDEGGPLPGLHVYSRLKEYRILICGGDGTVGWVLQCLDDIGQESVCSSPAIAILPLGTGNDLARVLKWGGGYQSTDDLYAMLLNVNEAEEVRLDRWTVIFESDQTKLPESDNKSNSSNSSSGAEEMPNMFVMNNYFGVGIDADLCLGFHLAREEKPEKFNSRLHNKGVYFRLGMRKFVRRTTCKELNKELRLEVDGKNVELPTIEGILVLNISSWGGGADPWGVDNQDSVFTKCRHDDGKLEVMGLTGVVHLGQIQSGLRTAIRLAQGAHIRIWMNTDMPVQVDGEPWMQLAGQVVVCRSALQATMLKKSKSKIKRRNTEPALTNSSETSPRREQARLVAMKSDDSNQV
ncbi:diacylglycerol kinase theta-like isoform X2 [Amphiura filiformis]|uniref:diacylglycerol kinase theta-like isoform X2 n=1 Tax=Amphiura filiformis TaxID=82378 RepID=UPI003B223DC5